MSDGSDPRLDGSPASSDPTMSAKVWAAARTNVWKRWLARMVEDGRLDRVAHVWPPHDARHDGIEGTILRRYYGTPDPNREEILRLAEEGLAEVANASAAARKAIPDEYTFRLRGLAAYGRGELDDLAYVGLMRVGVL